MIEIPADSNRMEDNHFLTMPSDISTIHEYNTHADTEF